MSKLAADTWSTADSAALFNLRGWSEGLFSIATNGTVLVHPEGEGQVAVDLRRLVDEIHGRGIEPPLLIRFSDILAARIQEIQAAFAGAIVEYGYQNRYKGVYPIKVNQDRFVVERLTELGREHHVGLEVGSKPELLAVIAMHQDEQALIICNGYKDREYVETALLASKLGAEILLVLEKPSELEVVLQVSSRTGIRPRLGVRARLSTQSAGRWQESGGERSKFGFSGGELLDVIETLNRRDLLDSLQLLHFHIGSQIPIIRPLQEAVREASRLYVELYKLGARLRYLDVGGGLGVDYDGSRTGSFSSTNYSLQEYANDVVAGVLEVCEPESIPHPILVSESGRALVAHHAVLVTEVLGIRRQGADRVPLRLPADAEPSLRYLFETLQEISAEDLVESYHDLLAYRKDCRNLFQLGHLDLEGWAQAESIFWAGCTAVDRHLRERDEVPEELTAIRATLADVCFCNFSLFQSIPDAWAIDQLFPVMPIQRLEQKPTRCGGLAEITCDADGTMDRVIGPQGPKAALEVHEPDGEPYYLGFFLVGAYQEILGDLHNLFGDTNIVNVSLTADGDYEVDSVVAGNTVAEVLEYVRYRREDLVARVRRWSERAIGAGLMTLEEAKGLLQIYDLGLSGYTYPERD